MDNNKELIPIDFNWDDERWKEYSGSRLFEELCWELVDLEGFQNLEWRGETHDKGRDLQADKITQYPANKTRVEKWWFQCKRYSNSINKSDMGDAFDHAEIENVDFFVIMSSSTLTTTFQEMIESWNQAKSKPFQTINWNFKTVEKLVKKHVHEISNLEKFFDVDRDIEVIREELAQREKEQLEKASKLRDEYKRKIKTIENKPSNFTKKDLKVLLSSCQIIFEANLKNEAIDLLSSLSKIEELKDEIQYQVQINLGDFYVKREWARNSIKHYAKAEEKSTNENELYNAKLKKGRALRIENDFNRSATELFDSHKFFEKSKGDQYFKSCLELFELNFEKNKLKDAKSFLDKISVKKGNIYYEKIFGEIRLASNKGDWESTIQKFSELDLVNIPYQLRLQINLECAFAYFQQEKLEKAIEILQKNCLPLVKESGDEDRLMVIYQNITHLKNARQDRYDTFWESYNKWSNLYSKNLSDYHKASLKGLNATELTLNEKYNQALNTLAKSQRIFSDIGSWNALEKNHKRQGYVFYKNEEYVKALDHFIKSSSKDYIKKTSTKLLLQNDSKEINTLLKKYLDKQNLTITENIGFCYTLKHLHEIVDEKLFTEIANKLSNLIFKKFSIDSNFDIKRPAIDALIKSCYRLSTESAKELFKTTYYLTIDEDSFWDVREKLLTLYIKLEQHNPSIIPSKEAFELFELFTNQDSDSNSLVTNKLNALLYQISKTNKSLQEKLIGYFNEQKPNSANYYYLISLGSEPDEKKLEKLLDKTIDIIQDRVVIENEFEENSSHPTIEYSGITRSLKRNGKRITVGSLPNLNFLTKIDLKQYDEEITNRLIETIIDQINYLENSAYNRISLLAMMANIQVNATLAKKINSFFWNIVNNGLEFNEKDNGEFLWYNGISNVRNIVKSHAIRGLTTNFDHLENEKDFINLIKKHSLSQNKDIRYVFVEAITKFNLNDEEIFLRYFSILISSEENIVSKCIEILNKNIIASLSKTRINMLVETLISLINKFNNSTSILNELRKTLVMPLELNIAKKYHHKIKSEIKELDKHRFYSVRHNIN